MEHVQSFLEKFLNVEYLGKNETIRPQHHKKSTRKKKSDGYQVKV